MTDQPKNDPRTTPETGLVRPAGDAASETRPAPAPNPTTDAARAAARAAATRAADRTSGARMWPRALGVLILLLGAGGAWLWQHPDQARHLFPGAGQGAEREAAAEARAKALEDRLAKLEQRPAVDPALAGRVAKLEQTSAATLVAPLATRLDALEKRPEPPPPFDPRPLQVRVEALESRVAMPLVSGQGTDLRPLISRIEAVEQRTEKLTVDPARVEALEARAARPVVDPARVEALEQKLATRPVFDPAKLDALEAKVDALAARDPLADIRPKVESVEKQLGVLTTSTTKVTEMSDRTARLARVQAAETALATGQRLGTIPNAPPALARFASTPPPTEADLRLAFPAAEHAALMVSLPDLAGKPFLERVLARLQDFRLITVRQGSEVVIGNSTAETLTHARSLLDAGDLGGAVKIVSTLTGPPADAMAAWMADAKAVLAAREALASLAGNG